NRRATVGRSNHSFKAESPPLPKPDREVQFFNYGLTQMNTDKTGLVDKWIDGLGNERSSHKFFQKSNYPIIHSSICKNPCLSVSICGGFNKTLYSLGFAHTMDGHCQ